ncbi:MAG: carboxypeptidase regulatory-like domain-containing protein [Planctomycetes bacterium]|nr:carboxypeptidase regulatory-like domain-containing protein [Planctomycetota bacterium]
MRSNRRTTLVLLALAALLTGIGVWFGQREEAAREEAAAPTAGRATFEGATAELVQAQADESQRETVESPAPPIPTPIPEFEFPTTRKIHGRVLDLYGKPVGGLEISRLSFREHSWVAVARSRADGSFDLESQGALDTVKAFAADYVTIRATLTFSEGGNFIIVVAPTVPLAGILVDETGSGIGPVPVHTEFDDAILSHFPDPLDGTGATEAPWALTNDDGTFSLPHAIRVDGVRITVRLYGYETLDIPQPTTPTSDLRLVVKRSIELPRPTISGVVKRANGEPAAKAIVFFAGVQVAADLQGAFSFRMPRFHSEIGDLIAVETGTQAGSIAALAQLVAADPDSAQRIQIVLGPPALSIEGTVMDADGAPLAGWRVALVDGSHGGDPTSNPRTFEALAAGFYGYGPCEITTSAAGRFEIDGLFDRDYRLRAFDPKSMVNVESHPIRAGTRGVDLIIPKGTSVAHVSGHVVSKTGTPLNDVTVTLLPHLDSNGRPTMYAGSGSVKTRPDGTFDFEHVPRAGVDFTLAGTSVIPTRHAVEDMDLATTVTLVANRRCDFRVEGMPINGAGHALGALDSRGAQTPVSTFDWGMFSTSDFIQAVSTSSTRVYSVGENAVEFVLYGPEQQVIGKRPVQLSPERVTLVVW